MGFDLGTFLPGFDAISDFFSKGHQTAAQGAREANQQFTQLGGDLYGQYMTGGQNALNAMMPAWNTYNKLYGNQGPGALENAFSQYGQQYFNPTTTSGVFAQAQGYQPTNTMGAGNQAMYMYGQTPNLADAYGAVQGAQGRSNTKDAYGQYGQQLSGPSAAQNFYGSQAMPGYQSQGALERYAGQIGGKYLDPGTFENWQKNNADAFKANTEWTSSERNLLSNKQGVDAAIQSADLRAQDLNAQMDKTPRYLNQAAGEVGGIYRNANDTQQFADRNAGQLEAPGLYEQFAQSALNGTNPYYDRIKQRGMDQINQQMIKRGGFDSGAALAALGNYSGELDAQQFNNLAQQTQGAQQSQMQRLAQGQSLAGASSAEKMGQGSALQGLAAGREGEFMNRGQFQFQRDQGQNQNQLAGVQLKNEMDRAASQDSLARAGLDLNRLNAGADAAAKAQAMGQGRLDAYGNMLGQSQDAMLARLAGGMGAAQGADQSELARIAAAFGMAQGADQDALARLGMLTGTAGALDANTMGRAAGMFSTGQGMDAAQMARLQTLGVLGNQADTQGRGALNDYFAQAGGAQDAEYRRMAAQLAGMLGLSTDQADRIMRTQGLATGAYGDSMTNAINALVNMYGIKGAGQSAGLNGYISVLKQLTGGGF